MGVGWYTPDAHAHAEYNCGVLHEHVLSAGYFIYRGAWFWYYHIVVVLDGQVVDMHAGTMRVDSVGIEGEERDGSLEGEFFQEVDLGSGVDFDVEVVELCIVASIHF